MKLILVLLVFLAAQSAGAFSYATGGCASGGCSNTPGEQWLSTNADEIDTALDAVEGDVATNTADISTLNSNLANYLPLSGGLMDNASTIDLVGSFISVGNGAVIGPDGTGIIYATQMSATGQIDDNDLAAGAVDGGTGGEIADGTITAADLATDSVTSNDILNDTVVLITDTAGDFIATLTGNSEITVSGAGTEGRAVTLAIDSSLTRDAELDLKSAATSTDNAVARFDLGAGDIQDSLVTIADSTGSITTPGTISAGGSTGASTFTLRNTVDSGWVECGVVGTTMTCAVDADGTPDGTL